MTTQVNSKPSISGFLSGNPVKKALVSYLHGLKDSCGTLSREQVVIILGQWYHPLHYFPTFLSRLISVVPDIETQTFISRILWQELGEGLPQYAHEKIYIETIHHTGFVAEQVTRAEPLASTRYLVKGYETASEDYLTGLGFLYGTEVVDLPMVATVGELMKRCSGKRDLPWVNIHIAQEPDHVESSSKTLEPSFTEEERHRIIRSAEEMWRLWIDFFKSIKNEVLPGRPV
jgi:pyrroloquinoline quinone (PQQ) biosynthesis protein C